MKKLKWDIVKDKYDDEFYKSGNFIITKYFFNRELYQLFYLGTCIYTFYNLEKAKKVAQFITHNMKKHTASPPVDISNKNSWKGKIVKIKLDSELAWIISFICDIDALLVCTDDKGSVIKINNANKYFNKDCFVLV